MSSDSKIQLVTFYSYKGGVGRTMAVANVACQLASKHGFDVIVVDWDLEAPGLHFYFDYSDEELGSQPGLIDYLEDFVDEVKKGPDGRPPDLNGYLLQLKEDQRSKVAPGSVRIMTCGRTGRDYHSRVKDFDWDRFYKNESGYLIVETLKKQLRDAATVTLIDARVGQADIGAVATVQIPDVLVVMFTSNRQSLEGAARIARAAKRHPLRVREKLPDLRILLVLSRVFPGAAGFGDWLVTNADPVFKELVKDGTISRDDQPKGLNQCILGVDPFFTLGESLPVLADVNFSLKTSYADLAQAIVAMRDGRPAWTEDEEVTIAQAEEQARELLRHASARGDVAIAAHLQWHLGQLAFDAKQYYEAEKLLLSSLAFHRSKNDRDAAGVVLSFLGRVYAAREEWQRAQEYYVNASKLLEEAGNRLAQSVALRGLGGLLRNQGKLDEAMSHYERALKLQEMTDDPAIQVLTLENMGDIRKRQDHRQDEAREFYQRALKTTIKPGEVDRLRGKIRELDGGAQSNAAPTA